MLAEKKNAELSAIEDPLAPRCEASVRIELDHTVIL